MILGLAPTPPAPVVPIYVVSYFPTKDGMIDRDVTGDVGGPVRDLVTKTRNLTRECIAKLEEGSRFRGYKLPSKPSLRYRVVGSVDRYAAIPTLPKKDGESAPLVDYGAITRSIDIKNLVEKRGVKEVWIWGYHGGVVNLWESNMSSPYGDVSNSDRNPKDLPVLKKTYTVYHYNYGRGVGEMLENHMHQFEALWNHVDGRDTVPAEQWPNLLFWGKFVGSDVSHKLVGEVKRCGWTHYAPNSEKDYDWQNPRYVETDIEDWRPDGIGQTQRMNSDRWDRDPIKWRVYWMQAVPGLGHALTHKGRKLRNWWSFVSDWDRAKREKWSLTH